MPLRVAAGTSMLSKPTATLAITWIPSRVARTSALNRSVNWLTTARLPRIRWASSAALKPSSESA
jgi:hypothetical protein